MKRLLWVIGVVLVVAVAGVLVGPGLVDWNKYKQDIQDQARAAIGRELLINGDISITVLPAPALIAKDVSLAHIKGAASKTMVRLKSLEVRIALAPLLGGQLQVARVKLVDPVIRLEALSDGRRNWIFDTRPGNAADIPPREGAPAGQEPQQASAPPVVLQQSPASSPHWQQQGFTESCRSIAGTPNSMVCSPSPVPNGFQPMTSSGCVRLPQIASAWR